MCRETINPTKLMPCELKNTNLISGRKRELNRKIVELDFEKMIGQVMFEKADLIITISNEPKETN